MGLTQVGCHWSLRVSMLPEARDAARLGFVGVDREGVVVAPAGVSYEIGAAT